MNEIQELLNKYSKQFECDFFLFDESFTCIAYTRQRIEFRNDNQDKEAVVSFQVGKHDYHIVTDEKENRDYLMVVAIACKNKLEKFREQLTLDKLLVEAIQDKLTDEEYARCNRLIIEDIYQLYLINVTKNSEKFDELKEIFFIDDEYVVTIDNRTLVLANQMNPSDLYAKGLMEDLKKYDIECSIIYGETIHKTEELHTGYVELLDAEQLSQIFYQDKKLVSSNDLGIPYLVSKISRDDIDKILQVWNSDNLELTENEIDFSESFMKNNLDFQETVDELSISQVEGNKLVEIIHQKTKLNIRNFNDAMKMNLILTMRKRREEV